MAQDACVIGAVKGSLILPYGYYDGAGGWTSHENAQVYYSRKALNEGLRDARLHLPPDAGDVAAFGVLVS